MLKYYLTAVPILITPNFSKHFILICVYGVGCVLAQIWDDSELLIEYMTAKLTRAHRNYSITELECLAVLKDSFEHI